MPLTCHLLTTTHRFVLASSAPVYGYRVDPNDAQSLVVPLSVVFQHERILDPDLHRTLVQPRTDVHKARCTPSHDTPASPATPPAATTPVTRPRKRRTKRRARRRATPPDVLLLPRSPDACADEAMDTEDDDDNIHDETKGDDAITSGKVGNEKDNDDTTDTDRASSPSSPPPIVLHPRPVVSVPTVSVVMTAYNCAKYIEHAIRSLQAQTLTNWELIVVDDRSTDHTDVLMRAMAEEDDRIVYLHNHHNLGCYASKNVGISHARGTWLTFHDADDCSMGERLEKQLHFCVHGDGGDTTTTNDSKRPFVHDCCYAVSLARKQKTWTWIPITMFVHTETFHDTLGAFDTVRFGADSEIRERMRVLQLRVGVLDDYLYACPDRWIELSRQRAASLTGNVKHDPIRVHYRRAYTQFHAHVQLHVEPERRTQWLRYPFPPPHIGEDATQHQRPFVVDGVVGDAHARGLLFPDMGRVREAVARNVI